MENLINVNTRIAGIFVFIWGFILGVISSSIISIPLNLNILIILISLTILIIQKLYFRNVSREIILITLLLISISIGQIRYEYKDRREINTFIHSEIGKKVSIEGIVVDEPERKDNSTRLILLPNKSEEKILINTDLYNHAEYGDRIKVGGKLLEPGIIKGEDGRDFNYAAYLSKDDIYYTMSFVQTEIISKGNGNPIKAHLFKIKNKFISKIRELFPEPESSLLAGLILAGKESLPKNILEEFRRAGIVHIVVLSGYNITIVAEFFLKIFSFLSIRIAAMSAIGSIVLFTLMTGGQATVVRAAFMGIVLLLGKIIGRQYSAPRALLVAGFLMVFENPKILAYDTSFKLSFLATLSLIYAVPIVNSYLGWVTEKGGIKSIISTTIGTQVVVLPYILYTMGNFSIVALVSNILTLFFIPITMLVGFVATLVGFVNSFLSLPVSYITHLLLSWILFVGEKLGNLSFASFEVEAFSIWILIICYGFYMGLYIYLKKSKDQDKNTNLTY